MYANRSNLPHANTAISQGTSETEFPRFRQALAAATQPMWPIEVLTKLTDLLKFEPGWDSYGALPVRYDAAMFAMTVLRNVMRQTTPEPSVVPSPIGGVQLEWHKQGISLEVHVVAPYEGEVWWRDHGTGKEHVAELGKDLSFLHEPIDRLSV